MRRRESMPLSSPIHAIVGDPAKQRLILIAGLLLGLTVATVCLRPTTSADQQESTRSKKQARGAEGQANSRESPLTSSLASPKTHDAQRHRTPGKSAVNTDRSVLDRVSGAGEAVWEKAQPVAKTVVTTTDVALNAKNPVHAMCLYAQAGNIAQVQSYLERGYSVNARDPVEGATPLMWAARGGNRAMVAFLVKHPDISVTERDKVGRSVIDYAVEGGTENGRGIATFFRDRQQ